MDERDRLKVRRDRQVRVVARLEQEVTSLRNRDGRRRASREALEGVLARHREVLRQFSAEVDAAQPKPAPCAHTAAVRVELSTGELAAWLCPDCDQQLPPEWLEDGSRRSLLAAVALLNKSKAEILLRFDYGPDMDRQLRAIDAEIARRMKQLSEVDRHFLD
ncbi:MAG: hypothetical protein ACRDOI_44175 [Trebonia sp.]